MTRFSKLGLLLAAGAMAFVATPRASATVELIMNDGAGHSVDVSENCGPGCVSFNGALGNWNINITSGTSTPGEAPEIDLNSIDHRNAGALGQTLTIEVSDNVFTPAVPGFQLNSGGTVGAFGTVTAALYGGTTDTKFDLSNQIGTTMSFSNPPLNSFSGSVTGYLSSLSVNPYALTEVATITFGGHAGEASFDDAVDAIPEPAGVLLLGSVMLLTVSLVRRRVGAGSKRA